MTDTVILTQPQVQPQVQPETETQPEDSTLSVFLFSTNLIDTEVIKFGTTETLAIAPNISIKCGDDYFNFVVQFQFDNVYQIDSKYMYPGWQGLPNFKVYLSKQPGVIESGDTCLMKKFDPRDGFCQMIFTLLRRDFKLTHENVIHLFHYLAGGLLTKTREHWSVVNLKIAAHNQLIDDGLNIGQILSIKVSRGKCYVKYSLPGTSGSQKGTTILGIKKLSANPLNHLDLTPILDNYEYENNRLPGQAPFLGFNVIIDNHEEHDGYILPVNNGWVKIERNRNLKSESVENNKYIDTNKTKFKLVLGDSFSLPVCEDIYEAYISARELLKGNLNKEALMDFNCSCISEDYKRSYFHYHKNINKQTETRGLGLGLAVSKKK